jgi:hypothetical protein
MEEGRATFFSCEKRPLHHERNIDDTKKVLYQPPFAFNGVAFSELSDVKHSTGSHVLIQNRGLVSLFSDHYRQGQHHHRIRPQDDVIGTGYLESGGM